MQKYNYLRDEIRPNILINSVYLMSCTYIFSWRRIFQCQRLLVYFAAFNKKRGKAQDKVWMNQPEQISQESLCIPIIWVWQLVDVYAKLSAVSYICTKNSLNSQPFYNIFFALNVCVTLINLGNVYYFWNVLIQFPISAVKLY